LSVTMDTPENGILAVKVIVNVIRLKWRPAAMDRGIHRQVMHGIPHSLHVKNAVKLKMVIATKTMVWISQVVQMDSQESSIGHALVGVKVTKAFILVIAAGYNMDCAIDNLQNSKSSVHG